MIGTAASATARLPIASGIADAGIGGNCPEIGDNSSEIADNSAEIGDDEAGIVDIAAKVIPC